MTGLHAAAHAGDIETLKRALAEGLDPNERDKYRGYTALHWLTDMAATGGPRREMLRLLFAAGADLNAVAGDEYGSTPLSLAREAGTASSERLVAEMLLLGANDNLRE